MNERPPRFHLSLRVRPERLDALVAFYTTLFATPPRKQHADHVQFDLLDPPLNLSFVPRADAAVGELDHLGLQVFSEAALDAARARMVAAGLLPREELATECCYARQDKFWLTDPEGREVEVFHKLGDLATHGKAGAAAQAASMAGMPASAILATSAPVSSACCPGGTCTPT